MQTGRPDASNSLTQGFGYTRSFVKSTLLASSALLTTPALAATDAPAKTGQQISSAGTGASEKDEILVTARRRQETSQEVPLAIAVIGGDHIDNTGAFNVGRLQQLTPTAQYTSSNPRNTALSLRGIGAPFGLTNDGFEQGVGIYVDDVYCSRGASSTFDFLDVRQIEVLRGPQGTLCGTNTMAGAINITSRKPTFDLEGRAEVTLGNLAFMQAKAATPQRFEPSFSAWNFSYDFNANYKLAHDVLIYATYARSFKSGGINLNGVPNDAAGNPLIQVGSVKPESLNHYEAGIKSQFWNRRVTLNLNAFRTDIRDFQALVNSGAVSTTRGYLANADKVRTQGFEVEFSVRPSERFNAYVNGSYTDAKYVQFQGAPCPPELSGGTAVTGNQVPGAAGVPGALSPVWCDVSGQVLPGVSKYALSYGAEANVPGDVFGKAGQFYFGVDGNYRSRFSSNPSPSAYTSIDGYVLTNFRAGFRAEKGIDVFGWVRNAFDVNYLELLQIAPGSTGLIVGNPGDPRTWGGTVEIQF